MKLTVRSLRKSFGDLHVLNGIDLDIESGRVACLMGPSGSGKTTLLRVLMGLEKADSGSIVWDSFEEPFKKDFRQDTAAGSVGGPAETGCSPAGSVCGPAGNRIPRFSAVFQEDRLCEAFTPLENVMMVTGRLLSPAQVRAELARLLPEESLSRPVATLSGGMKRRTAICRALLAPYDVLLMDEPFTGLDEGTRQTVISYILEKSVGRMVLISTHQEEDVALLGADLIRL